MLSVLVIDDQETLRNFYDTLLTEWGFSVTTAVHGLDALKKCAERGGPFDLVILDWLMPVMNGDMTKKHLEETYPGIPIVVISGSVEPSEVTLNRNQFFLTKPFRIAALKEILDSVFQGRL